MVAEIYPRMTSLIKNSKWRRDLLKGCLLLVFLRYVEVLGVPPYISDKLTYTLATVLVFTYYIELLGVLPYRSD